MAPADTFPTYWTDFDVADRLGQPVARVRKWARAGSLPALILPDGSMLFDPSELAEWLRTLPRTNRSGESQEAAHA